MVEKSKKWAIVVVGLLLIAVIASAGCAGETPTEPSTAETLTASQGDTQLSGLLAKVESIPSVKYDLVKTLSDGKEYTSNVVWVKESMIRCEMIHEGEIDAVILIDSDEQVAYRYYPETEKSMKMDFNLALSMTPTPVAERVRTFIESYEEAAIPSTEIETIDGKVCTVLGMSVPGVAEKKMWIWQEYGLPIQEEMTTPSGTSRTEMKNIELDPIPDSMFELPAGAEMM